MKIQNLRRCSLGLTLAVFPFVGGCEQRPDDPIGSEASVAFAGPAIEAAAADTNPPAPIVPETTSPPPSPSENTQPVALAAGEAPAEKPAAPPNIRPSSPLGEVVKLAQAGVDDSVMFAFVTNSTGTFGLGSAEIIYLNDLGVPPTVITSMIEHDQAAKLQWANAAQAQAAAVPAPQNAVDETASAPTYVNPPQSAPAPPQPTVVNNNYFYDTLSPYGNWVEVDGYGLCWQPTVVVANRSWQPYCDRGHWVYSDCGWYWLSDYSWGWATFHYGRWFSHPRWGWCWWPDRVWGPSWVTWRSGGDYCGWAPLPPGSYYRPGFGFSYHGRSVGFSFDFGIGINCYTFVPLTRFCDARPYRHRLPSHQVTQVFNNTTVINNYGSGNHNTVINHGIAPERISAASGNPIRKVAVRDAIAGRDRGGRNERLESDGRTLAVHRPQIPENRIAPYRGSGNADKSSPETAIRGSRNVSGNPAGNNPPSVQRPSRDEVPSGKARSTFGEGRTLNGTAGPAARPRPNSPMIAAPKAEETQRSRDRVPAHRGVSASPTVPPTGAAAQPAKTAPAPAKPTVPTSSLIVIGKGDRRQSPTQTTTSPTVRSTPERLADLEKRDLQAVTPPPAAESRSPGNRQTLPQTQSPKTHTWAPKASPQTSHPEITRPVTSPKAQSSYSVPAPVRSQPAQRYSPPVSSPGPVRNYNPPPAASAPAARSYSPPPATYAPQPAPRPSYSPPAASPAQPPQAAPSRSDSGPRGRDRH